MISVAGVIGTGLFLGSGQSLANAGPLGLLLGYSIWGTITISMMVALGSMISHLPLPGGHIALATRLVDPAFSFSLGWTYCLNWTTSLPVELAAAVVLLHFWSGTKKYDALWITILYAVVLAINACGARVYGESEFWFGSIKVVTIVGLIVLGIVIDLGGGPEGERLGFQFWKNPGPFVQYLGIQGAKGRFLGFWRVLIQAAFSYNGTEIIAMASGEAKNPRRTLPRAVRRLFIRILLFYILGVFIIGLLCPSNDQNLPGVAKGQSTAANSPFVIAIKRAGIKGLPSVINAAILTSAWSAGSSNLYTSSRSLYGLALSGGAPTWLLRTNKFGLPWLCLVITGSFGLLTYIILVSDPWTVFDRLQTFNSVIGLITWWGILATYLRFHEAVKIQNYQKSIPYTAPFQPYLSYYGLTMISLVMFFNGFAIFLEDKFDVGRFIVSYLPILFFLALFTGYRLYFRTSFIDIRSIDLDTGSRDAVEEVSAALVLKSQHVFTIRDAGSDGRQQHGPKGLEEVYIRLSKWNRDGLA
ncbi:amino acid permease [Atractiella rhizophila]|nr:amino acid permease [Atractiella rhizophila]